LRLLDPQLRRTFSAGRMPFILTCPLKCMQSISLDVAEVFKIKGAEFFAQVGQKQRTRIDFTQGDMTDLSVKDWSDGDVIFANSTCYDDTIMEQLARKAAVLKKGTIFITLTKKVPSKEFQVLEHQLYQMSWGGATVFISQKVTDPEIEEKVEEAA
jgi:hypothetical protein